MTNSNKILMTSLLLLTACATPTDRQKQSDCGPDFVRVLNEETGKYDCVSKLEWERVLETFEENW